MNDQHLPALARALCLCLCICLLYPAPAGAQQLSPEQLGQLTFRHIGPVGNRLIAVAGIPGDPMVYYAGAASGGIWKTTDGGLHWKPIFDDKPVHAIGALAVAPSDPSVVWAGTGESFIRSNVSIGNGVWRSTDGGGSWQHVGLEKSGRIGRVIAHPTNPDIAYVAALGHSYQPQKERGIYRTLDGGKSWQQILAVNDSTGASDLVMDPHNPRILFAGMWQLDLKTWNRESGGHGSGIFMSRDGGDTWKRLEGNGLPKLPVGKVALAMTPADPNRVYALIETGDGVPWHGKPTESGELWRSDDGGKTWKLVNHSHDLAGRTAYYSRCAVSPDNPDKVYFLSSGFAVTIDGGKSVEVPASFEKQPNWDHHDMWIDPTDANRMIVAGDGGLAISHNQGASWFRVALPVAQLYHVTTDNHIPYHVYTNRQDGPSMRGPSRSRIGSIFGAGSITRGQWHTVGGGESGFATPDPVDPDVIWSSTSGYGPLGGIVVRYNEKNRQYRQVEVWPDMTAGSPASAVRYRWQWTFPLLISPHDHNTVYVTSQHVHRTTNGGQSWEVISPDLTTNDKSKQTISGGLTPDNIGVEYGCVIYALDESPLEKGVLWAGTNDGLVQLSRDGGKTWKNLTANIKGLPPLGTVRNIEASKWKAGKAYLTVDFHEVGNFDPFVYKTEDYGATWTKITRGIASDAPLNYVRHLREDPVRPGLLYLGTENALYFSFDDGASWQSLMTNLPHTPMYWIDVQEHFNDLVIGTYGRGIWILDDITALQQLTPEVANAPAHLFRPQPAYRFRPITEPLDLFNLEDPVAGQDPPPGASLHFWLKEATTDSVTIRIVDAAGDTLRTLKQAGKAGINRLWWDLLGEPSTEVIARTKPRYADWVALGDDRIRKLPFRTAVLAPPGAYRVILETGGKSYTQSLELRKDPHSDGSLADIEAQTALSRELHDDMNQAAALINQIELIRRQLYDLKPVVQTTRPTPVVAAVIDSLDGKLIAVEEQLIQLNLTGSGQDEIRYPARLIQRIAYLAGTVAESADFPPTDQHREVHQLLRRELQQQRAAFDNILARDLAAFRQLLQTHQIGAILMK